MEVPSLHVGAGSTLGPLTVFPVWTAATGTLDIATGTNADVSVSELANGPEVGRLTVTNNGRKPALLLDGELLEGGQQHRTCVRDVVLGAGETRDIDTYCVEAGRWEHGQNNHRRQARRAPLNVRSELVLAGTSHRPRDGQGRVWERVSRFGTVLGPSATDSLLDHLDRANQDELRNGKMFPKLLDGQRGVVIGVGNRPLLLEIFGTSALFRRHYRQLVASTLLDVTLMPSQAQHSGPTSGQLARDFAGVVQALNFGPLSDGPFPAEDIEHHMPQSRPVSGTIGAVTAAGIAIQSPRSQQQLAHLSCWNTKHPLMEAL
ncbi:ARPP-1 family domain-containing protein [Arthrobacter zhaoxinii]|uniref:ARPP-1 family domain-containing protein n=1 Tax=Arthrobacter zhaoxinii TaxID=2964616 RepID=UPI0021025464|nr:DUF6569 family protein [Arthrobacter zhaoxinii]MCQ2001464.1 hypothetical protein [Arthrobacter zhaoxinii]